MKTMAVVIIILCLFLPACMVYGQDMGGGASSAMSEEREAFGIGIRQEPTAQANPASAEQVSENNNKSASTDAASDNPSGGTEQGQTSTASEGVSSSVREVTRPRASREKAKDDSKASTSEPKPEVSAVQVEVTENSSKKSNRTDKIALMATGATESKSKEQGTGKTVTTAFGMIGKLIMVCVMAYLVILALKNVQKKQESRPHTSREVKLVDTVRLTPSSTVHVLDIQGKKLLIGCSANQVNLLQEFECEEVTEAVPEASSRFAEYLQQYSAGSKTDNPTQRIAGLLRDCSSYLRKRYHVSAQAEKVAVGEINEG